MRFDAEKIPSVASHRLPYSFFFAQSLYPKLLRAKARRVID